MTDSTTSGNQPDDFPTSVSSAESTAGSTPKQTAESSEANPLKRYQDLVNSPETPDGHKVVAAVAAASTVTVAAVANWLMKATKKATPSPTKDE
ncbi:MAG TPA: hypothetical protein VF629_06560 [Hymenobacter sp.]|jgi:hypothetical protein|uniref:hypothetical protein n=1 Tax=Hymenobacter sp. TaxID=1898978 RepID=UPI002ED77DAA